MAWSLDMLVEGGPEVSSRRSRGRNKPPAGCIFENFIRARHGESISDKGPIFWSTETWILCGLCDCSFGTILGLALLF